MWLLFLIFPLLLWICSENLYYSPLREIKECMLEMNLSVLSILIVFCEGVWAVNCVCCTVIQPFPVSSSSYLDSKLKYTEDQSFNRKSVPVELDPCVFYFFENHSQQECRIIAQYCDETRSLILEQLLDRKWNYLHSCWRWFNDFISLLWCWMSLLHLYRCTTKCIIQAYFEF